MPRLSRHSASHLYSFPVFALSFALARASRTFMMGWSSSWSEAEYCRTPFDSDLLELYWLAMDEPEYCQHVVMTVTIGPHESYIYHFPLRS